MTDPLSPERTDTFGARIISGFAATMGGRAVSIGVSFGTTIALARLLGPEAYGLMAMATVVTGFLAVINDVGLAVSVMQKKELEERELNSVFWLQLGVSGLIVVVAAALAPIFGSFYGRPEVAWIIWAIAPLFLILGGFTQHRALLRRKMRYPTLAGINLMAVVVSSTVGILAAVGGLGFWALVIKELGSYLALLAGMWWAEPWRPGAPKVDASVRHHVDFSKYLFGSQLVRYASRSADRLLLGLHFGATTAGLYERSISLLYLPVAQLAMPMSSVINPSLARVQDDPEKFREVYLEATRALSWMVVPLSALFVVTADELVSVLLGEAWMDATALFALIGASMAFQALDVTRVWIFTPLGRTDRMFRFTTLTSIIMLLAIVSAARLGPEVLASVRLGVMACIFVGGLVYTHRGAPVVLTDTLRAVGPPFGAGFAVVSLRWVPIRDLTGSPLGALVAASAAAAVVTAVMLSASGDAKRLRTALGTLRRR